MPVLTLKVGGRSPILAVCSWMLSKSMMSSVPCSPMTP